jgi:thymidylate kinase
MSRKSALRVVSFSGIDGAGKSTQINALNSALTNAGIRVTTLEFWDDVVVFSRFREFMSHKAFKGDQGVGSPEQPLHRRDKNVNHWPVTLMRLLFYIADCANLRRVVMRARNLATDVVIFDRYIYDELANLPLHRPLARAFVRLVLRLSPQPDAAFLVDADPVAAWTRKPEYPLEFVHRNREAYLSLRRIVPGMILIEPSSIEAAEAKTKNATLSKLFPPVAAISSVALVE